MFKKGQAAMEYLMTYGWAILVVLISLGALFYLGVFNPTVPSTCQIAAPFSCQDILGKDGTGATPVDQVLIRIGAAGISNAQIVIANGIQVNGAACPITKMSNTATGQNLIPVGSTTADLSTTENTPKVITCTATFSKGDKFSGTITVSYKTSTGGLDHTTIGQFSGTVE